MAVRSLPIAASNATSMEKPEMPEKAALLDLKPYTVKEYARRGILPGRKLGRTWRFLRPELEEAIRQLPRAEEEAREPHRRDLRSPL